MPRPTRPTLAILVLVLALAACAAQGSSGGTASQEPPGSAAASAAPSEAADAPPTPGTDLDACEIVTVADIAAAVGIPEADVPAGEVEAEPTTLSPGHTECRYEGEWGGLIVDLTPEDGANLYDAARGSYADASDREVTGADGAFWSEQNHRGFFWKGSVTVMLQMSYLANGADVDEVVTAIGQAAMDKVD